MVTRSCSCSQLVLLLIMVMVLALPHCDASKGVKNVGVQAEDGVMVPGRKDMNKAKFTNIPPAAEISKGKLGGRKMMSEGREVLSDGILKKEESKRRTSTATTTVVEASKISGASSVGIGNIKHTLKRKLNMQSKLTSTRSINHRGKVYMGGFMALNTDYHMARAHPPRNN